ncbi:MAG TPA: MFS transporter, partial [Ktedonobacteraceae bacterium]|nr:MFS transporter [Ktedonobacteraceae bacterium]
MQQKETELEKQNLSTNPSTDQKTGEAFASRNNNALPNKDDGQEHANKWAVLAILAIGIFMATLDTSIVNISLPTIAHYFHVPLSGAIEWVIIAYLVVIAGVLLTTGRLADMIGRKPIWIAGLIIFTTGSAI